MGIPVCQVDDGGSLFISPAIDEWAPLGEHGIDTVIDLDGGLDHCVPTVPNQVLYVYFPIYDEELPDLDKLGAIADLAANLIRSGHKVLSRCGMGFNRSALVAGLTLCRLGHDWCGRRGASTRLPPGSALQRPLRRVPRLHGATMPVTDVPRDRSKIKNP